VVINNLNPMGAVNRPDKADAPLIIDPDAVLTLPITAKSLQVIAGWHFQRIQQSRCMQLQQLSSGNPLNVSKSRHCLAMKQRLGLGLQERMDHA
jgi:hypothetical protein